MIIYEGKEENTICERKANDYSVCSLTPPRSNQMWCTTSTCIDQYILLESCHHLDILQGKSCKKNNTWSLIEADIGGVDIVHPMNLSSFEERLHL